MDDDSRPTRSRLARAGRWLAVVTTAIGLMFVGMQQGFGTTPWGGGSAEPTAQVRHHDGDGWWRWWKRHHRPPTTRPTSSIRPTTTTTTTQPSAPPSTTTTRPAPTTTTTTTTPPPAPTTSPAPPGALPRDTVPQPGQVGFRGDPASLRVIDSGSGLPAGATWTGGHLRVTGDVTLENVHVRGGIELVGGSLTLRNSIVEGNQNLWATILTSRGTRLDVRDSTLRWASGAPRPGANWGNGVLHGDATTTAIRNDISGAPDGIQTAASNSVFEQNWIHDLAVFGTYPNNTHNDGVQSYGGANNKFRYNRIDIRTPDGRAYDGTHQNAALFFMPSSGFPLTNVEIVGNYLAGGGFTLRLGTPSPGAVITGNQFGPTTGGWGELLIDGRGDIAQWSNNRRNDGAQLPRP